MALLGLIAGAVAAWGVARWAAERQQRTGETFPVLWAGLGLMLGLALLGWLLFGRPTVISWPALRGFNLSGGARITPEFSAVLFGLTVYTSAFIAEIVRSGILAVPKGQTEAARALGLKESVILTGVWESPTRGEPR